jgi:hypothetical protein
MKTLATLIIASLAAAPQAYAESSLSGSWSGGGTVVYASGQREHARCQANFSGGGASVAMNATCATPSGSVSQSAQLRRVGANTYAGSFFNPQFNVTGHVHVVTHGNTGSVTISSGSGSAHITIRH